MTAARDNTLYEGKGAASKASEASQEAEMHVPAEVDSVVQDRPRGTWKSYVWDTLDKAPEERRFLFKLDAVLLTFASLGYFIKYLDQVNINNAFVSGMKEDLDLFGNQLNYMIACWTAGYVIGEVPRYTDTPTHLLGAFPC